MEQGSRRGEDGGQGKCFLNRSTDFVNFPLDLISESHLSLTDSGSSLNEPKLKLTDFCGVTLYVPHPNYKLFVRVAILTIKGLPFALETE